MLYSGPMACPLSSVVTIIIIITIIIKIKIIIIIIIYLIFQRSTSVDIELVV